MHSGIIKGFIWPALRHNQLEDGEMPEAILVKFDDENVGNSMKDENGYVRISALSANFEGSRGYGTIERTMFPIILSWAVTVHKLQGVKLSNTVIDLGIIQNHNKLNILLISSIIFQRQKNVC